MEFSPSSTACLNGEVWKSNLETVTRPFYRLLCHTERTLQMLLPHDGPTCSERALFRLLPVFLENSRFEIVDILTDDGRRW